MRIVLIAAIDRRGVIGREGKLPWHLPADLRRFRATTMGRPVIMGRRTFDSIGRPLPGRMNIMLTRSRGDRREGVHVVHNMKDAIESAREAVHDDAGDIFVIGGGEVYAAAMPVADILDLTEVDAEVEGDARFPEWSQSDFRLVQDEAHPADSENAYSMRFRRYERIAGRGA